MNASVPSDAFSVPNIRLDLICASPSNPRKHFDDAYLNELAESIKAHGLIQPITVRPMNVDMLLDYNRRNTHHDPEAEVPMYQIVVGECRWRAAKIAGLEEIPAFWREMDDKQALEIQVIENLQRRDVSAIEEADGYRALIDQHGYTADQIGEKIGKSRSYVYGRMKLASLGQYGREQFFSGKIDASVALLIARIQPDKDQERALKDLDRSAYNGEPISFREAKWKIRNGFTKDLCHATFPLDDETILPAAGSCARCMKRSGNAPEICPDIDSADVCTDTKCFEEKRLARREQLLGKFADKKIPVFTGDKVKEIAPHETKWSINKNEFVALDDRIDHDPEHRTYREVLGDTAPVVAVVELGKGTSTTLVELADTKAIAKALKKAGLTVPASNEQADDNSDDNASRNSDGDNWEARRQKASSALEEEEDRRSELRTKIKETLIDGAETTNLPPVINAIAIAAFRQSCDYTEFNEALLNEFDIQLPNEYDEDEEIPKICQTIGRWQSGKALAFLAHMFLEHEHRASFDYDQECVQPACSHDAIAASLCILELANDKPEPGHSFKVGDRVRISDDARGPNGNHRKCCGREGEIVSIDNGFYSVRFGPNQIPVTNLKIDELLQPASASETSEL